MNGASNDGTDRPMKPDERGSTDHFNRPQSEPVTTKMVVDVAHRLGAFLAGL
jgi:hypothetical protein